LLAQNGGEPRDRKNSAGKNCQKKKNKENEGSKLVGSLADGPAQLKKTKQALRNAEKSCQGGRERPKGETGHEKAQPRVRNMDRRVPKKKPHEKKRNPWPTKKKWFKKKKKGKKTESGSQPLG